MKKNYSVFTIQYSLKTFALCSLLFALPGCTQWAQRNQEQNQTVQVVDQLIVDENSVPIFPKKAVLTTDTARRFALDLPKRCKVDWDNQSVLSVLPEEPVEVVRLNKGDVLPEFAVKDYDFEKLTTKQVLDKLLDGTNIAVIEDESLPDKITGSIKSANLSDAVDLISRMGHAYYSYDDAAHELHLTSTASFLMKMPKDQDMIMALVDAMHGEDLRNLLVNWEDKTLQFDGNYRCV